VPALQLLSTAETVDVRRAAAARMVAKNFMVSFGSWVNTRVVFGKVVGKSEDLQKLELMQNKASG
jgi:hypothetical protein